MSDDPTEEDVMDTPLRQRLDEIELEIRALDRELRDLRYFAETAASVRPSRAPEPVPVPTPFPAREPVVAAEPVQVQRHDPREGLWERVRAVSASQLSGERALAWTGGIVTLLGTLFFFVLAVNRGWIGPGARVACGAIASALLFGVGVSVRRRYGQVLSGSPR